MTANKRSADAMVLGMVDRTLAIIAKQMLTQRRATNYDQAFELALKSRPDLAEMHQPTFEGLRERYIQDIPEVEGARNEAELFDAIVKHHMHKDPQADYASVYAWAKGHYASAARAYANAFSESSRD